ncbi:PREDICTED: adenylate cyclase type 9 [Condylura cristata]|uniref:adenylate cyclase type 9 n=1 Tax=Condylura cristata TaxID=143302 RepID=UPI0006434DC6|nr:PREDICTED: adenylate cyclase type 9 [Condylura cristata]
MASPPHQQLLPHHSTEVSCDSSGDSNSVRVRISPKQLASSSQPKHCKYSISSSCSSSGDSGGAPRRVGGGGRLRRQRRLPQLFERASRRWWDPRFDSVNLEEACLERCFPQTQRRFQCALFYIGFACLLWSVYFGVHMRARLMATVAPALCFLLVCAGFFLFTFTKLYARHYVWTSLVLTLLVCALTLATQFQVLAPDPDAGLLDGANRSRAARPADTCLSQVGGFSMCIEVLFLLYAVMHLPLYLSVFLGVAYSVLFETFGYHFRDEHCFPSPGAGAWPWELLSRALLHVCVHAIGIHLFIMSQVRSRSTFLKVGQSIMHGKDLEVEKALKERMIHSVMPRIIADDLMRQGDEESESAVRRHATSSPKSRKKKSSAQKAPIAFRPFKMQQIEDVSILFADIVGFTKMSANKSAHALVGLLNDLFGRFDRLCEETKCEKISTLGDCYYCVAGCPEPRADHAYCCIEMGLGMIRAIEQFCQEKKEMVNMRVGVHTGTVLCGILGMRRFKFDVWSNDVNLANLMEQLGVAGKVHISEATAKYLDDRYEMEDGKVFERLGQSVVADQLKGLKTYLIAGQRAKEPRCSCSGASLSGLEASDGSRVSAGPRGQGTASPGSVSDLAQAVKTFDNLKACPSCGIALAPQAEAGAEGGTVRNGGHEEQRGSSKASGGPTSKTHNGLLSPPPEEKLTNSQTSLCEILQEKGKWAGVSLDQSALLPLRFKNIREKTDAHFVDVIKEDSLMKDYFFKPPINQFSLNFLDRELERAYRSSYQQEVAKNSPAKTFASATFSSLLDVFLSTTVFLILSTTCFLKYGAASTPPPPAALGVFGAALLLEVLTLVVSIRLTAARAVLTGREAQTALLTPVSPGPQPSLALSRPVSVPCSHFAVFAGSAVLTATVHYCNFCQLSSWMRSALATVVGAGPLLLLHVSLCPDSSTVISHLDAAQNFSSERTRCGGSLPRDGRLPASLLGQEVILVFFLLLLLVWFLNREFEVSYRLHYHGDVEADLHRTKIQSMRDQADWLLRNIIPYHVAEQLKVSQTYSKNHDSGAVIFASIVNFSEFYEENYEGGKECYRVLNELIGDFDELLGRPAYGGIEKIKTIGATYMAAAGLNATQAQDGGRPQAHLQLLFEFAREMMRVVDDFNSNMLWFNFKLRVGFNHGPLTAGVIGTTKLLYDIWGDTVNIASRMDTTGVECRIQVSEESYRALSRMGYEFDYRGTVNVKGKGQMKTYLYPRCSDSGLVPQHQLSISPDIRVQVDGSIGRSPTDEIASLVPSVQGSDRASLGSDSGVPARDAPPAARRLWRDPGRSKLTSKLTSKRFQCRGQARTPAPGRHHSPYCPEMFSGVFGSAPKRERQNPSPPGRRGACAALEMVAGTGRARRSETPAAELLGWGFQGDSPQLLPFLGPDRAPRFCLGAESQFRSRPCGKPGDSRLRPGGSSPEALCARRRPGLDTGGQSQLPSGPGRDATATWRSLRSPPGQPGGGRRGAWSAWPGTPFECRPRQAREAGALGTVALQSLSGLAGHRGCAHVGGPVAFSAAPGAPTTPASSQAHDAPPDRAREGVTRPGGLHRGLHSHLLTPSSSHAAVDSAMSQCRGAGDLWTSVGGTRGCGKWNRETRRPRKDEGAWWAPELGPPQVRSDSRAAAGKGLATRDPAGAVGPVGSALAPAGQVTLGSGSQSPHLPVAQHREPPRSPGWWWPRPESGQCSASWVAAGARLDQELGDARLTPLLQSCRFEPRGVPMFTEMPRVTPALTSSPAHGTVCPSSLTRADAAGMQPADTAVPTLPRWDPSGSGQEGGQDSPLGQAVPGGLLLGPLESGCRRGLCCRR